MLLTGSMGINLVIFMEAPFELAGAVAVELVLDGTQELGAGGHGAGGQGIDVVDDEDDAHRRAAERAGAEDPVVRVLVGDEESGAAEVELGVAPALPGGC